MKYLIININNEKIEFKFNELEDFEDFEKKVSHKFSFDIMNQLPTIIKDNCIPEIPEYKSEEGLNVYIKELPKYFILLSIGEFQYGLYKIFIEAILEKKSQLFKS
jgi:hypothetical protein